MKTARAESQAKAKRGANAKAEGTQAPIAKEKLFALVAGIWIGISLVKFGNPVIFDHMVTAPQNMAELIFTSWPIAWGYVLFAGVALASLMVFRPKWRRDHWPILLLCI